MAQIAAEFRLAGERWNLPTDLSPKSIAQRVKFESFAEMEDFALDVVRRTILSQGQKDAASVLAERVEQWNQRTRRKAR